MNTKKRGRGRAALAATLVLMVAVLCTLGFLVLQLLNKLQVNAGDFSGEYGSLPEEDSALFETLYDITDASNLNSFLFQWWHSGGDNMVLHSRDVVNVLLIGADGNHSQPGGGRSDAMMLVSVNKRTRRITLLSLLRDSYCYYDINGEGRYNRLNSAYFYGGPQGLVQAVRRLYKIRVDRYVTVDLQTFPPLVDALGGVTVDVTPEEARYINRTAPSQGGGFPAGPAARLTGQQALIYSRIRKLDSDAQRVNRQQKVLESILQSARQANVVQLYNALDVALPYVQTNYYRTELLGLIPQAAGWLNFGLHNMSSPILEGPESSAIGAAIDGMEVLIVDYPKAAREVQLALYGQSNIDLQDDAHRSAYIEELFAGAERRRAAITTPAQAGAQEADTQASLPATTQAYTETETETTTEAGFFWPFAD